MQINHVSKAGRVRATVLIVTLGFIALYAAQKAWGLWRTPVHSSDLNWWGLDVNNILPATLLTVVAIAAIPAAWFIVVELLTSVGLDENGILFKAPGYRIFYRWDEIDSFDVITGPVEDAATVLQVETTADRLEEQAASEVSEQTPPDPIEPFLSEADLREDKIAHRRNRTVRKQQQIAIQSRAVRNDGTSLKPWLRLLYPQARHPDRLLLYPALENRTALLAQIEAWLAQQ